MALLTRIAFLEAAQQHTVDAFSARPWPDKRPLLDRCAEQLIAQGHLPPPDPEHPRAPIDAMRQAEPEAFAAWVDRTVGTDSWWAEHGKAVCACFLRAVREEEHRGPA